MQRDTVIFDLIDKELERQRHGIELIASENFTSLQVMQQLQVSATEALMMHPAFSKTIKKFTRAEDW